MAKLELQSVRKAYNPTTIPVKDVSLSVEDGEFLTLLGPSGCGKSTTLRLIAGLEQPTAGNVLIGGRNVNNVDPGHRNIAMVFQSYALYPHMTVYENIAAGLKLRGMTRGEIHQRVDEVAGLLGLNELLKRKPGQLSGGQRQRVALGRTLVRKPDIFLLDEPLSNLDALLREHVRAELKQLFEAQKAPVVYVTHDQTEAMTLSTKVAVFNDGYLQQLDPPKRIYSHPASRFVAGFVGSPQMNFLTIPCEGNYALLGERRIPLPGQHRAQQIVLGIRPEHVRLADPGDTLTVHGTVQLVEPLGMHNLITLKFQQDRQSDHSLRFLLPADRDWSVETATVALPSEHIHWFDSESGVRVGSEVSAQVGAA
ncbi:ABC transporter ATP-binding protein [Leptolyngbya sp. FACHB-261]|uniref:ABC transporter ATP-binding protein n=1 Tax=Leptolyngbya sp. FACHB-261 TaxID=2692806 RepID=UPI0016842469|nr:ABC transporter ATP-binding protein [Leptolyngbya sp. FACHB-261]MBD2100676.1 ABC transporter ATP-binding protein [Leptolyngbya sp. FACHB-261]